MARPDKFTVDEVVAACEDTGGILALAAANLQCSRRTVERYRDRYATVREALQRADEELTDRAEVRLRRLIDKAYWPAVKYRLDTKGKDRGYTTKAEVDVTSKGEKIGTDADDIAEAIALLDGRREAKAGEGGGAD